LVAHSKKNSNTKTPELEELAFSGLQEFARQWVLVKRQEKYEPGSGSHKLWFEVGGSAGFSGRSSVHIEEGVVDENFSGRRWDVTVRSGAEEAKRQASVEDDRAALKRRERLREYRQRIVKALRRAKKGDTLTGIRTATGIDGRQLPELLEGMVRKGILEPTEVEKNAGKAGKRLRDGFKLARRSKKSSRKRR